jgi:hypothetical protein
MIGVLAPSFDEPISTVQIESIFGSIEKPKSRDIESTPTRDPCRHSSDDLDRSADRETESAGGSGGSGVLLPSSAGACRGAGIVVSFMGLATSRRRRREVANAAVEFLA